MRIPTCPLAHQQINLLSLDRCSRPKRALICETEPLLSAVVRKHQQKSPDNWEEGGRRMRAHNGRSTSLHPRSLTDSFQWALNLLFSRLWYWKSCFFSVQHITQCNIMKPEARGGGMIIQIVFVIIRVIYCTLFLLFRFFFFFFNLTLFLFNCVLTAILAVCSTLFWLWFVLYVWKVLHKQSFLFLN